MRMLKCPQCRRQTAWLEFGTRQKRNGWWARYKEKHCNCGYVGTPKYGAEFKTLEELHAYYEQLRGE